MKSENDNANPFHTQVIEAITEHLRDLGYRVSFLDDRTIVVFLATKSYEIFCVGGESISMNSWSGNFLEFYIDSHPVGAPDLFGRIQQVLEGGHMISKHALPQPDKE